MRKIIKYLFQVTFKTQSEKQALKNTNIIHNINTEISKLPPNEVLSIIDPKIKKMPAPILRKSAVTSTDYESSEELSSNEDPLHTDDNEDVNEDVNDCNSTGHSSCDVIREIVLDDGRKEILYSNGNLKKISADGKNVKVIYYNGDVKESREDSERYYFAKTKTYHTTYKTGLEIIEFPKFVQYFYLLFGKSKIKFF